jgi:hypothetical protein
MAMMFGSLLPRRCAAIGRMNGPIAAARPGLSRFPSNFCVAGIIGPPPATVLHGRE